MRTDIFGLSPRQHDMFGGEEKTLDQPMTVDEIRAELTSALDLLEASAEMPWPARRAILVRNMFPEIATKLPPAERDALIARFDTQMRRLRPAAA